LLSIVPLTLIDFGVWASTLFDLLKTSRRYQMVVTLVARTDTRITGLARYAYGLYATFQASGQAVRLVAPALPPLPRQVLALLKAGGIDLPTFFQNYPLWLRTECPTQTEVLHLTSQNLASLLALRRSVVPTVVTIHDLYQLIENRKRGRPRSVAGWADHLATAGIKKADEIIASSAFTRQTIVDLLNYPAERIHVIHLAVDREYFKPQPVPPDFRARHGLPEDALVVLFVGSEDPRKNLETLLRAFHLVALRVPRAVLVKAGAVHFHQEAERLRTLSHDLGLAGRVHFLGRVDEEDLPLLYNTADLVVMPSRFEGFGLPALEAMTCGRPVAVANASSLPEVVGNGGVLFDPLRVDELALVLIRLLEHPEERQRLAEAALDQARCFSPERQAEQTWAVYRHGYERAKTRMGRPHAGRAVNPPGTGPDQTG
ncbi:MAG: glycosyltransferase family 4 protein, partial [Chloroflexaceae bacterium]|nr:glycosyltransferase family 4 protein [Chloroflexaceae bacterium]